MIDTTTKKINDVVLKIKDLLGNLKGATIFCNHHEQSKSSNLQFVIKSNGSKIYGFTLLGKYGELGIYTDDVSPFPNSFVEGLVEKEKKLNPDYDDTTNIHSSKSEYGEIIWQNFYQ